MYIGIGDVINVLDKKYVYDIIECDEDMLIIDKLDFEYGMIEYVEDKLNIMLDFEYKIDDDIEIVEIIIRN